MGYYIPQIKFNELIMKGDAVMIRHEEAKAAYDAGFGVICVVSNPMFDAVAFCYSRKEMEEFASEINRQTRWFMMDRTDAEVLSGYAL